MAAACGLRGDMTAGELRQLAKVSDNAHQVRRLLALATIYDGGSRTDAATVAGVGLQTIRDWVLRFNAQGPAGLVDGKAPGAQPLLNAQHRQSLVKVIEEGPVPAVHGVVRWRISDLTQWIWEEFHISVSIPTLSRELRALGYRRLSARPRHHGQADDAIPTFKKTSGPAWKKSKRASRSVQNSNSGGKTKRGLVKRTV